MRRFSIPVTQEMANDLIQGKEVEIRVDNAAMELKPTFEAQPAKAELTGAADPGKKNKSGKAIKRSFEENLSAGESADIRKS